jgi:hypothetical protein
LVAAVDATLADDGEPFEITEGVTRISADDALAWSYPQAWRPLGGHPRPKPVPRPKLLRALPHRRARRRGRCR